MMNRADYVLGACRDKKVLHLGCCDAPFCREATVAGRLLHFQLREVTAALWGLDLSEDDVVFLRESRGLTNLVVGDAQHLGEKFPPASFEVVVAAEILEHLPNPGQCLGGIREVLTERGTLVVTVPNGLSLRRGLKSLAGRETVHPDHNFYFSRKTITHLVESCGFRVTDVQGYRQADRRFLGAFIADRLAGLLSPWACEGIMLKAEPRRMIAS